MHLTWGLTKDESLLNVLVTVLQLIFGVINGNQLVPGCKPLGLLDDITAQSVDEYVVPGCIISVMQSQAYLVANIASELQVVIGWGIEDFFWLDHMRSGEIVNLVSLWYVGKWQERIEQHRAASMGLLYDEQEYLKAKRMVSLSLPRSILPKFHLVWLLRIIVFLRETIYLFYSIYLLAQLQSQLLQIAVHPELGTDWHDLCLNKHMKHLEAKTSYLEAPV